MAESVRVHGVGLDDETRCVHYHGPTDIVAIRHKCCGDYYACKDCHDALAGHPMEAWPEVSSPLLFRRSGIHRRGDR